MIGGEPEDQTFSRDWSWVPDLLNQLSNEIKMLKDENLNLQEKMIEDAVKFDGGRRFGAYGGVE